MASLNLLQRALQVYVFSKPEAKETKEPCIIELEVDEYNLQPGRIEVPTLIHGLDLIHLNTPSTSFTLKRLPSSDDVSPVGVTEDINGACSRDPTSSQPNSATGSTEDSDCQVTSRQSSMSDLGTRPSSRQPSPRNHSQIDVSDVFEIAAQQIISFDASKSLVLAKVRLHRAEKDAAVSPVKAPVAPMAGHRRTNSSQSFKPTPEQLVKMAADCRQAMKPVRLHARGSAWHQTSSSTCNPYDLGSILGTATRDPLEAVTDLRNIRPARSPPPPPSGLAKRACTPLPSLRPMSEEADYIMMIPGRRPTPKPLSS